MATVLLCLALNIAAFFYLHAWRPVVDLWKWMRLSRQIKAMRVAGLMLLLCAVCAPSHAQTKPKNWYWTSKDGVVVEHDGDYVAAQSILQSQGYSMGEDGLVAQYRQPDDTTGYPALDNALRYVWNNCGKLMVVFFLLAVVSMLRSKMESQETYGDVLRREAAERWEEETDDDSIHNPFDSPEGMQPTTQYVPVRTRS